MAQQVTTNINPDLTSGAELAFYMDQNTESFLTAHSGTQRPPYALPGMTWTDTTDPDLWLIKVFDGDQDILVGSLNTQTKIYTPLGAATAAQGAKADSAIQPGDNVSRLNNDAGFITTAPAAPVDSVNGKTGAVSLAFGDVGALGASQRAADSTLLNGIASQYYMGLNAGDTGRDPNVADSANILTRHANCPDSTYYWHIWTAFYSSITNSSNRAQIAVSYNRNPAQTWTRAYYSSFGWSPWVRCDNEGATVVTATSNSNGYYRIWSDGLKEQWGQFESTGDTNSRSFPVAFTNAASIGFNISTVYGVIWESININSNVSVSGFVARTHVNYGKTYWTAKGY